MKKIKLTRKEKKQIEDMDYEIGFYEGLLDKKPDFIEALEALGDLYTKRGFVEKGLTADVKLSILKPEDPYVHYNLACSYSLLESLDKAFRAIKMAVKFGYDDLEFLEFDEDLENLRKDLRFQRYIARIKSKQKSAEHKDNKEDQQRT